MTIRRPPIPSGEDWKGWATQIYRYLADEQSGTPQRKPLRPATLLPTASPSEDGVIMWDANLKAVVVSRDGEWRPLQEVTP